jgi:hypothetical protein
MVAADPARLTDALTSLLGGGEVSHVRAGVDSRAGFTATVMVLADQAGGALVVRREAPAFTPAEFARAHALVQVAAVGAGAGVGTATNAFDGTPQQRSGQAG